MQNMDHPMRFNSKRMGILMHKPDPDGLDSLKELFETDKLKPVIDKVYPLSESAEALRYFEGGHAKGKVVIAVVEKEKD